MLLFALALLICVGIALGRLQALRRDPLRAFTTPTPRIVASPAPTHSSTPAQTPGTISAPTSTPTLAPVQVLGANKINIVLMGLDSDEEREAAGRGYRSDTIVILVIDVKTPGCTVLSVPRDTRAKVQRRNDAGKVLGTQYTKINSAFSYGGGPEAYGHENLLAALTALLFDKLDTDVALTYYASIDMDGICTLADAVGGVPLTLAYDMQGFGKEGDVLVLQGEQARAFVRMRHGITGGSDIARVSRQQDFLYAFAKRIQQLGAKDIVPVLWGAMSSEIHTNLKMEQIIVLVELLTKVDLESAAFITLPGRCKTIDGRSYYVPDTREIQSLAISLWGEG